MERDRTGRTSRSRGTHAAASSAGRSHVRRNRLLALAILAVLALAAVAPAGQASGTQRAEAQARRALAGAQRLAEREAKRLQRREAKAHRQAERQAKSEGSVRQNQGVEVSEHAAAKFSCTSIVVEFSGLSEPEVVTQKVIYRQAPRPTLSYVFEAPKFTTSGTGGTETIPIVAPLGESNVGIRGRFSGHGPGSSFNLHVPLTCGPDSQYSLATTQSLGGGPFTSATLPGVVGETVDYQTVATNNGNTPLVFGALADPGCDGPIAGGSAGAVAPRSSVVWYCHHTLTTADQKAGAFANAAATVASPQQDPFTSSIASSSAGVVISPITAEISTAAKPAAKSGVLGSGPLGIPALYGPTRCVRGVFSASVKSPGVSNVTFYIDGRKLARRTAHSAVRGWIAIHINGAKLKAGVHRLLVKISMSNAATGSRSRIVRRCSTHRH